MATPPDPEDFSDNESFKSDLEESIYQDTRYLHLDESDAYSTSNYASYGSMDASDGKIKF